MSWPRVQTAKMSPYLFSARGARLDRKFALGDEVFSVRVFLAKKFLISYAVQ